MDVRKIKLFSKSILTGFIIGYGIHILEKGISMGLYSTAVIGLAVIGIGVSFGLWQLRG